MKQFAVEIVDIASGDVLVRKGFRSEVWAQRAVTGLVSEFFPPAIEAAGEGGGSDHVIETGTLVRVVKSDRPDVLVIQ